MTNAIADFNFGNNAVTIVLGTYRKLQLCLLGSEYMCVGSIIEFQLTKSNRDVQRRRCLRIYQFHVRRTKFHLSNETGQSPDAIMRTEGKHSSRLAYIGTRCTVLLRVGGWTCSASK